MRRGPLALLMATALMAGCTRSDPAGGNAAAGSGGNSSQGTAVVPVTVTGPGGTHVFRVELARTAAAQAQGLMYRTDLKPDGGMLFSPHPAEGGPPKPADFWMKNTPTPLDIAFIRPDGTIARLAENTVPFSETHIQSGEPVSAVLEIVGGRAAELGIAEGDRVTWPGTGPGAAAAR